MNICDDSGSKPYDQISFWPDKTADHGQLVYEITVVYQQAWYWQTSQHVLIILSSSFKG